MDRLAGYRSTQCAVLTHFSHAILPADAPRKMHVVDRDARLRHKLRRLCGRQVPSGPVQRARRDVRRLPTTEEKVLLERVYQFDDPTDEWEQLVVEDKHSTPAEVASTRIDFRAWLESLPERTRHVAETLATGEATSHVARMFSMSASRISQFRQELYQAWRVFQGEAAPATSSALA